MKNIKLILGFLGLLFVSEINSQTVFMVTESDDICYQVDVASGAILSQSSVFNPFGSIAGFYGMARNPIDQQIYVLVDEGSGVRSFGTLDLSDFTVATIGYVSYKFQTMQFSNDGTCYAMTASNDDTPSQLCEISLSDGSVNFLSDLNEWNGFAQALVYDSDSSSLYRIEGGGGDFGSEFYWWQEIDLNTYNINNQNIMNPILVDDFPWKIAMCYLSENNYILTNQNVLWNVTNTGDLSNPTNLLVPSSYISGIILDENVVGGSGCTDILACNFDDNATEDDGTCIYPDSEDPCSVCDGLTDGSGIVIDSPDSDGDGLCDAEEINVWSTNPEIQDTDGDGITDGAEVFFTSTDPMLFNTNGNECNDLEQIMGNCGVSEECEGDFNNDSIVNAADLLSFLGVFGLSCE